VRKQPLRESWRPCRRWQASRIRADLAQTSRSPAKTAGGRRDPATNSTANEPNGELETDLISGAGSEQEDCDYDADC
jgi:hypothetical protein